MSTATLKNRLTVIENRVRPPIAYILAPGEPVPPDATVVISRVPVASNEH